MENLEEVTQHRFSYFDSSIPLLKAITVSYTVDSTSDNHTVKLSTAGAMNLRDEDRDYHVKLSLGDLEWIFKIYPFSRNHSDPDYVSVYIGLNHTTDLFGDLEIPAEFSFSSGKYYSKTFKSWDMWGLDRWQVHSSSRTLSFSVKVNKNYLVNNKYLARPMRLPLDNCNPNIELLLTAQGDVVIRGSGWKYQVHKEVITKASCVFKAMFTNKNTEEAKLNEIVIKDIKGDVMKAMLEFMYFGNVRNLDHVVNPLYIAANKYCVEPLEEMCVDFLHSSISPNNAVDTLHLAVTLNNETLRKHSLIFISKNIKQVMESDGWKSLESFPKVVLVIVNYLGNIF